MPWFVRDAEQGHFSELLTVIVIPNVIAIIALAFVIKDTHCTRVALMVLNVLTLLRLAWLIVSIALHPAKKGYEIFDDLGYLIFGV